MIASLIVACALGLWLWRFERQGRINARRASHRRFQRRLRRVCVRKMHRARRLREMQHEVRLICQALENRNRVFRPLAELICPV